MMRTTVGLVAVLTLCASGCAEPWVAARGAITAADAALDALPEDIAGDEHREELATARAATGAALDLGRLACDIWQREAGDAPAGWQKWIADALTAAATVADALKAAGVAVPPAVAVALTGLQLLLPLLTGG